jgi:hypothetical protein
MIYRIHSSMLVASFALAAVGCGGGGGSGGGPPGKLSDAFISEVQTGCEKGFSCQSSYVASMHNNQAFSDYMGGSTVDACVNTVKTLVLTFNGQDYFTKLDASVTAGRIKYSASDFDTCTTAAEAATCDQFFQQNGATYTPPAACDTFKMGQVATSGACTIDDDCSDATNSCDANTQTCG